jgi:hypothetical protein
MKDTTSGSTQVVQTKLGERKYTSTGGESEQSRTASSRRRIRRVLCARRRMHIVKRSHAAGRVLKRSGRPVLAARLKKPSWGESEDRLGPRLESTKLRASAPDKVLSHPAPMARAQRTQQPQKEVLKMPPNWGFDPFDPISIHTEGFSYEIDPAHRKSYFLITMRSTSGYQQASA